MGAGGTEWVCDAGKLKADHCPLVVAGVCNFPVDFLLCRVNDKWAGLTQPGALKHVRGELIWKIFLSPLPAHMVWGDPRAEQIRAPQQPLSGVPITLINSKAKGRLQLPAHSWLLGKATLECMCLKPVSHAERRAALFLFTVSKAGEK